MQIISSKALIFFRDGYNGEKFTIRPGSRPQSVPDWVRETATFKYAANDGSVIEVEVKPPLPMPRTGNQPTLAEQKEAHNASGVTTETLSTATAKSQQDRKPIDDPMDETKAQPKPRELADPVHGDASARPLGANPFPAEHPAYNAFEEATWRAKEALNGCRAELLEIISKPPFDFIQAILTFRVHGFSACADAALLIVGNEGTAEWYEHWLEISANSVVEDTLRKGQLKDPKEELGSPQMFTPELLPRVTVDLKIQIMRVVAHYKKQAANRVLQAMELRGSQTVSSMDRNSGILAPSPLRTRDQAAHANIEDDGTSNAQFNAVIAAKQSRALTVAKLIGELDKLKPQLFEDESEYQCLRNLYPDFLTFRIADTRADLKTKVLAIRSSTRHIRLAQELAAAHCGRQLSTIQDDWKDHKPQEFKRTK